MDKGCLAIHPLMQKPLPVLFPMGLIIYHFHIVTEQRKRAVVSLLKMLTAYYGMVEIKD